MNFEKMSYEQRLRYLDSLEEKLFLKNEDYMNLLDSDPMGSDERTKVIESEIHKLATMIGKLKKLNAAYKQENKVSEEEIEVLDESTAEKLDDEPTERLDDVIKEVNKRLSDSVTIKLPQQSRTDISNVKVFFDGKSGLYKINYLKDNQKTTDMVMVDKDSLDYDGKNKLYTKVSKDYGEEVANSLDYNVYTLLGNFDKKNGTFMQTDYVNNTLKNPITYDFRGFSKLKNENIGKSVKEKIKNIAKEQRTKRNANLIRFDYRKIAAVFITGGLLASVSSLMSLKNKNKVNALNTESYVEVQKGIENEEVSRLDKGIKVDVDNNLIGTVSIPKQEIIEETVEEDENKVFLNEDMVLEDDVSFYYDCYENGPSVKAEQLNCDFYRSSKIAIIIDGLFKEFYESKDNQLISIDEVKEMYEKQFPGSTIECSLLVSGYKNDNPDPIYTSIGYTKAENIKLVPQKEGKTYK